MSNVKRYPPIQLGLPGEDISKKDLHAIIQRFKNLNQLRQQRVQEFLQERQQVFLQILPLLFHQNHPLLPGFISSETAAGIPDYKPNKQAIQAAKKFSKSFTYKRRALLDYPIQSIFLMGSVSSIAFSKTSDMDIWLCHQPDMSDLDKEELQQKATDIEKWANSFELEVHFFLVNSEQFSQGHDIPISDESSGTTQHYLLLEEFYRTAIYIAGKLPAWWLVPPEQEYNYSTYLKHLIDNRFISENEVIDFGGLESIPAEEFITATLWHIYKSLNSPHKSLLKLFLMECYASEYPQPEWLCFELKTAIYQGTFDVDRLDPYLLIYTKVEDYLLLSNSTHRLKLARQCFYLKIMGTSSKALDYNSRLFRENYIKKIAEQWNWSPDILPALNKQKSWDIKKATQEHSVIRIQLKHSLRMILSLAGEYVEYNFRENNDLKLISRKLHTFLEKKPGKVEIITTRSAIRNKEDELSIVESNSGKVPLWSAYSGKYNHAKSSSIAIKQEQSLLALLSWLVINGLYKKQLHLHFESHSLTLNTTELHRVLDQINLFISETMSKTSSSLNIYNKPDQLLSSLFFINLGIALDTERDDGLVVLSDRSDPLSYGKNRHNFIQQIDQISISSWGEIITSTQLGLNAFFNGLSNIFNNSTLPVTKQNLKIVCYVPTRAKSILLRAESIFANLLIHFANPSPSQNVRYFLPSESSYTIFQRLNGNLQFWTADTHEQLIQELAKPQNTFSKVQFDPFVLEDSLIPFLYSQNRKQTTQVFYYSENNASKIIIIDEKGSLYMQDYPEPDANHVLNKYALFLESLQNHPFYSNEIQLKFYEVKKSSTGAYSTHATKITPAINYMDLSLLITSENTAKNTFESTYYIYCNDIEFNSIEYGQKLFTVVSQFIMDSRKGNQSYPIYISDIEAPLGYLGAENITQLQTIHYLTIKKKIEARLNT